MKKLTALLVALLMLLALLAGCDNGAPEQKETEKPDKATSSNEEPSKETDPTIPEESKPDATEPTNPPESKLEKLEGDIYRASDFSEGLAVVVVGGRNGRGCVINKAGEIVFDLPFAIENSYIVTGCQFYDGYMAINGGICDKNGNFTYPEDVGATNFYTVGLEGGYVIAEVVEATFDSTKKSLGILNTDFEWVVEPSEEIHSALSDEYGNLKFFVAMNTDDYYHEGFVYVHDLDVFLEMDTGRILTAQEAPYAHPSKSWDVASNGTYWDVNDEITLDISSYDTISHCSAFENGLARVVFKNAAAGMSFFTLIDEKGEFLFEPVDFGNSTAWVKTDGETILVSTTISGERVKMKSYDMNGNLIAEFDTDSIGVYSVSIRDGVIQIEGGYSYSNYVWFYTPEFEPLF